jgi:hypothetical protein
VKEEREQSILTALESTKCEVSNSAIFKAKESLKAFFVFFLFHGDPISLLHSVFQTTSVKVRLLSTF